MARKGSKKRKIHQEQQFPSAKKRSSSSSRLKEKAEVVSQAQMVKLTYEYTIADLSLLPQKNGESFYSPIFSAKDNRNVRWRLRICPEGANEESKDHLSLYLERVFIGENDKTVELIEFMLKQYSGADYQEDT